MVEFNINFMQPVIGARLLAIGQVPSAGKWRSACIGEVRACTGDKL